MSSLEAVGLQAGGPFRPDAPGGDRAWGLEAADPRAKVSAMRLLVETIVLTYLLTYNRSRALVKRFFAFFSSIAPEARPPPGR